MNPAEIPLLGRTHAVDILATLLDVRRANFTSLLKHVDVSRRTLSLTLRDLLEEGLVVKKSEGKYSYYTIAEKGIEVLKAYSGRGDIDFIIDRITQLSIRALKDTGILEKNRGLTEEQLEKITRRKASAFVKKLGEDASKGRGEGRGYAS